MNSLKHIHGNTHIIRNKIIQDGRDLRSSLVQSSAQRRVSCKVRPGCSGFNSFIGLFITFSGLRKKGLFTNAWEIWASFTSLFELFPQFVCQLLRGTEIPLLPVGVVITRAVNYWKYFLFLLYSLFIIPDLLLVLITSNK